MKDRYRFVPEAKACNFWATQKSGQDMWCLLHAARNR